ncbi:hypothetical protein TKK_0007606 [Trichogramma kaykai]
MSTDYVWALGLNRLCLRLMGVWPADTDGNDATLSRFRVPIMISVMFFNIFLPQMYALALVLNDLPLVIDNLMTSSAAFTSCFKLFFLWKSKNVMNPVVESMRQDWLLTRQDWSSKIMRSAAVKGRIFTMSGYLIIVGCYCGFAVSPFLGFNIRMMSNITDYGDRHMLVQSYYPYDYSKSPVFELTLGSQLVAGIFIGMSVSVPDNYFAALVFHYSAQFKILGARVERLIRDDCSLDAESHFFSENWPRLVDRHVHLMTMVSAIEQSFTFINLGQILCMSCMVCCLGFELSIFSGGEYKPSALQILTLVGTLIMMMSHTLVDCIACELLASNSSGVFHHISSGLGSNITRRKIKDIIPMLMTSMKPRKLTAGKMFSLNLASYCSILKSIAGYISMLIAVNQR